MGNFSGSEVERVNSRTFLANHFVDEKKIGYIICGMPCSLKIFVNLCNSLDRSSRLMVSSGKLNDFNRMFAVVLPICIRVSELKAERVNRLLLETCTPSDMRLVQCS